MLTFIKKDLLIFWRDRRETALAVLLPLLLVIVLNFAFSNVFGTDARNISISFAIINEDDEALGLEQFENHVLALDLPVEAAEAVVSQARAIAPVTLIEQYFANPELSDWLTVKPLSEAEALRQVEQGEIDATIRIPAGYTYDMLRAIVLGEDSAVSVPFIVKENTLNVSIISDVIRDFFDHINFQLALQHGSDEVVMQQTMPQPEGGRETIAGSEPFTMGQYFTIAMAVLFALFLATTVAGKTASEKREQVFNRIVITNTRPHTYLIGKFFSTFCLVLLQFMIVVLVSEALLGIFSGKAMAFWLGLFVVAMFYALFIASLSALYTSIMLRMKSIDAANALFLFITMLFGTVGGSFVPIHVFPEWLQNLGEWTPNGFTLAMLTEWIQFGQWHELKSLYIMLGLTSLVCFAAGISLFPKRGDL